MTRRRCLFLSFVLLLALPVAAAANTCNSYGGVTPSYLDGYGYYCGNSGAGCTECYNFHPGGVQVCIFYSTWNVYCTDYGQEYQWP